MPTEKKKRKKVVWIGVAVIAVVGGYFMWPIVNAYLDIEGAGFLDAQKQHKYSGTSMENLKALHQAVSLYYESEGVYPDASGWMDAAKGYVKTADLKKGEEMKKFVNPRIPEGEGVFGYAFNSALSMGYREDVADPAGTALIFESKDTKWNANGDPATLQPDPELDGGNNAVTVEGNAVPLKQLLK